MTAVFDQAHVDLEEIDDGTARLLDPLSRKLQGFVRRNLFRMIKFEPAALYRFAEATRNSPEITQLVELVQIIMSKAPPPRCDKQLLFDFFRSASSLRTLGLGNAGAIQQAILSARFALVCFPSLQNLQLSGEIPFDSENSLCRQFRNLPLFRKLKNLDLEVGSEEPGQPLDESEWREDELVRQVVEHLNGGR